MANSTQVEGSFNIHFNIQDGKILQNIGGKLVDAPKQYQQLIKDFLKLQQSLNNVLNTQLSPEMTNLLSSKLNFKIHILIIVG